MLLIFTDHSLISTLMLSIVLNVQIMHKNKCSDKDNNNE